mgnify:CR=1 FL=1
MPSAVAQLALDRGFPGDLIFTPERAGEVQPSKSISGKTRIEATMVLSCTRINAGGVSVRPEGGETRALHHCCLWKHSASEVS